MKTLYVTSKEVARHNSPNDCWVSLLGKVYDLTNLLKQFNGSPLALPILNHAGEDISHWFDEQTKDVKKYVDPDSNLLVYYTPQGRFIHVSPKSNSDNNGEEHSFETPWWKDEKYIVGRLSKKTRMIRIVNMLTNDDHKLEVCEEEKLSEILQRYSKFNAHAASYTWKRLGKVLDMNLTLEENGVIDETLEFEDLSIRDDYYIPAISLYFNDDLTSA